MLAAMVAAAGGEPWILPVARDTAKSLDAALASAATADLLLITGGVSAGKFDLVEPALARAGARFHFTGVRIQPGKPLVFGEMPPRRPRSEPKARSHEVLSSGFPAIPSLPPSPSCSSPRRCWPRLPAAATRGPRFALARLTADVKAKPGLTRFLPAACTFAGPIPEVALVPWQGCGDLAAMARANCFLVVPEEADRLQRGRDRPHSASLRSPMPKPSPARPRALSHFDASGQATMVDVSAKQPTRRTATASAFVELSAAVLAALPLIPKAIRLRSPASPASRQPSAPPISSPCAIPSRSRTSMCRPQVVAGGVRITATAATTGPTGVEMEALTAAAVAALTVYDMTKALDKAIVIRDIRLESKSGGKSGDFSREDFEVKTIGVRESALHSDPTLLHERGTASRIATQRSHFTLDLRRSGPPARRTVRKW